jgi:hypothetical protein
MATQNSTNNTPSVVNIQIFSGVGTTSWTKPTGAKYVHVLCIGGGGGGGSGTDTGAAPNHFGGGGGGGGGYSIITLDAANVLSTETVIVASGGLGGASPTISGQIGNNGQIGGTSSFGNHIKAIGGGGGGGGSTTAGAAGTGGAGSTSTGGVGGAGVAQTTAGTPASPSFGPGGGGGGAGDNGSTNGTGGPGGGTPTFYNTTISGGLGGIPFGRIPTSGITEPVLFFGTGGGGGSVWGDGVNYGINGANGGLFGGGGGGSSESGIGVTVPGTASGGTGGQGIVVVSTYF